MMGYFTGVSVAVGLGWVELLNPPQRGGSGIFIQPIKLKSLTDLSFSDF